MNDALHGRPTDRLEDEYKIYLQYQEDAAGVCSYRFEIVDHAAAAYDAALIKARNVVDTDARAKAEEDANALPKGHRRIGKIEPGERSYQGLFGFGSRKRKDYEASPLFTPITGPSEDASPRHRFRNPFKKK